MFKRYFTGLIIFNLFSSYTIAMQDPTENVNVDQKIASITKIQTKFAKIRGIKHNNDGSKIVAMGNDCNFAQVWDTQTKKLICELRGHAESIQCILFHTQKDIVFTGSEDGKIKIWNASSGECINTFIVPHGIQRSAVTSLAFFDDKYPLLLSGYDNGNAIIKILTGLNYNRSVFAVQFDSTPQNRTIVDYTSFNSSGTLAYIATAFGTLKIYARPRHFNIKQCQKPWKCILECNLGSNIVESVANNNDHVFIKLTNIRGNRRYIIYSIIKNCYSIKERRAAHYCINTNKYLTIKNKYQLFEHCLDHNRSSKLIWESTSEIINATYNSEGNQINVTTHDNKLHLLENIDNNWICTNTINHNIDDEPLLIIDLPNKIQITATLMDNIITLTSGEPQQQHELLNKVHQARRSESPSEDGDFKPVDDLETEEESEEIEEPSRPVKRAKNSDNNSNSQLLVSNNLSVHINGDGEEEEIFSFVANNEKDEEEVSQPAIINSCSILETNHIPPAQQDLNIQLIDIPEAQADAAEHKKQKTIQTLFALHDLISFDRDIFKKTLIEVIANHPEDIIEKYIAQFKGNFNEQDNKSRTPLYAAASTNKEAIVKSLAKIGADVNIPDSQGFSPLHVATNKRYLPIVQCLLAHKALVNSKTSSGLTPLHIAVNNKDIPLVSLLLEANANMFAEDNQSTKPIDLVISDKDADLIELFTQKINGK